jgi:glycosyltransferase involved in cell wall biosynthesis
MAEGVSSRRETPFAAETAFLTVVMPLHEGADWIRATLESLTLDPIPDVEILAFDSSSDERTSEIARSFSDRLPIRIERRPDLKPWPAKMNAAVKLARTDYVCMLHQDDVWLPDRIEAVRRWVRSAPDACLHLAPSLFVDRNGKCVGRWNCPLPAKRALDRDLLLSRLLVQNFVSVPAPVFKRQAWLSCGGMDETLWYTADWDIWLKLASAGPAIYHGDFTTGFRVHSGSLTVTGSRSTQDFRSQMETVLDRHLDEVPGARGGAVERRARASIAMNVLLASGSHGPLWRSWQAGAKLARLGPGEAMKLLRDTRLRERVVSRLRAGLGT